MNVNEPTNLPKQLANFAGILEYKERPISAVYFLVRSGCVVYVGKSESLATRLAQHATGDKDFNRIFYIRVPIPSLFQVEMAFITLLEPKYNHNKNGKIMPDCGKVRAMEILRTNNIDCNLPQTMIDSPAPRIGISDSAVTFLNEKEAAAFLGLKPQTLAVWRCTHRHDLPFYRIGSAIRYRKTDLDSWLDGRREAEKLAMT